MEKTKDIKISWGELEEILSKSKQIPPDWSIENITLMRPKEIKITIRR